ncbi:putative RNA-binding protein 46 isoform X2 [Festucalex cinctus]
MEASSEAVSPMKGTEEFMKSMSIQMALVALMDKTGYDILQENGQRTFGGPPPNWEGPVPHIDCEVFVGSIPRDMFEDELVPLFETAGTIYELRLMMDFNGDNRGYAFVKYTNRENAQIAIQMLNDQEVRPGMYIAVCAAQNNCRLFIGGIPKDKSKKEIMEEVMKVTKGLVNVTVSSSTSDAGQNRGFAFLEYETHKAAAFARKELIATRNLWGRMHWVNWAKPDKQAKGANMQNIRVAHVLNLSPSTTEETLQRECERYKANVVVRVKKFTNHAFLYFACHKEAVAVTNIMNGATIDGSVVTVGLVKYTRGRRWKRSSSIGYQGRKRGGRDKERVFPHHGALNECSALGSFNQHFNSGLHCAVGEGKADRQMFPILRNTPLQQTSLQMVPFSQINTAVSLLDLYCCAHSLPLPHYQLFSVRSQDGTLLLVFKVVMLLTQKVFMPDKLCVQLDDAKELAAQNVLWSLGITFNE